MISRSYSDWDERRNAQQLGYVRSPLMAASATFALKAGEWFRRGRLFMLSPDSWAQRARCQAETPLIVLSRFPRPALSSRLQRCSALQILHCRIGIFPMTWHHVACFSAVEDDLSQWRGYGGGECGFAIGLDVRKLNTALKARRSEAVFVQMIYDAAEHERLAKDALAFGANMFAEKIIQNAQTDLAVAAGQFLEALAVELDILATMTKHPKFFREEEWRMVAAFQQGDFKNLEFRQKRTLLARYLPIELASNDAKLPITRICVGPGGAQRVSQISVDAALKKYGYPEIKIEISQVPFRVA